MVGTLSAVWFTPCVIAWECAYKCPFPKFSRVCIREAAKIFPPSFWNRDLADLYPSKWYQMTHVLPNDWFQRFVILCLQKGQMFCSRPVMNPSSNTTICATHFPRNYGSGRLFADGNGDPTGQVLQTIQTNSNYEPFKRHYAGGAHTLWTSLSTSSSKSGPNLSVF